jgi:hypothetical protein
MPLNVGPQVASGVGDPQPFAPQTHVTMITIFTRLQTDRLAAEQNFTANSPGLRLKWLCCQPQELFFEPGHVSAGESNRLGNRAATRNGDARRAVRAQAQDIAPGAAILDKPQSQSAAADPQPIFAAWRDGTFAAEGKLELHKLVYSMFCCSTTCLLFRVLSLFHPLRLPKVAMSVDCLTLSAALNCAMPPEVFQASRWTRGNLIFPTCIEVTDKAITRRKRSWFKMDEITINITKVASVHIKTGLIWSEILIESSGGSDPLTSHGHRKADAIRIKEIIENAQAEMGRKPQE